MSTLECPPSTAPVARGGIWTFDNTIFATAKRMLAGARRALWSNRPVRLGIVWGTAAYVVLQLTFVAWVHFSLEGVAHRALLPGIHFGLPEREGAAGFGCVSKYGYDGQQYYWMSNDIFGRHDAARHLDEPLYRYQRIGVPMLAGSLATLLGYPLTPTPLFFAIEFAMTAAGFGGLVYWLVSRDTSPLYALGWLLSGGTLFALWVGVLDGPADALFVFTVLAVFARRLAWYVPLATVMLLTRETYSMYAFAVFVVTAFGKLDWKDASSNRNRLVLTALPGVVMLGWTAYLTLHFHMSPIAARGNPGLKGWPFTMIFEYARIFFQRGDWLELRMLITTAFALILVAVLCARNFRRLPLALACAVPLVLMNASTGRAIWEAYGGSMRMNGPIIILGLFLMSIDKTILLKFMLALQIMAGLDAHTEKYVMNGRIISPKLIHEEAGVVAPNPPEAPDNPLLNDLSSSVAWIDAETVCRREYQGPWSPVHREIKVVRLAVMNKSDVAWEPGLGKHPLSVGCKVYSADQSRLLGQHLAVLPQRIAPGETKIVPAYIELRRPGQKYVVCFSLYQDGPGWFIDADPGFGSRYELTVE